eukprot:754321-Hanusia_phi.AAC.5
MEDPTSAVQDPHLIRYPRHLQCKRGWGESAATSGGEEQRAWRERKEGGQAKETKGRKGNKVERRVGVGRVVSMT